VTLTLRALDLELLISLLHHLGLEQRAAEFLGVVRPLEGDAIGALALLLPISGAFCSVCAVLLAESFLLALMTLMLVLKLALP
jgi:hypothetical protein